MSKRLQIDYIDIKKAIFAEETRLTNGILSINKNELYELAKSSMFSSLEIELVSPGDNVRLACIHDLTQPRVKADDPETSFPGLWGKLTPAGEGRTVALRGILVSELYNMRCNITHILDMGGPIAKYSHFSKHFHIVLNAKPAGGVSDDNYAKALKHAALSICVHLAKLGIDLLPDETEVFEMTTVEPGADGKSLPKVAYIVTHLASFDTWQFFYYGKSSINMLPTIVHPNEILDGAMIRRYWEGTYYLQNENVIRELYRRHGKDIEFVGVVISNNEVVLAQKDAFAMISASLAKHTLKADAVISNKSAMGHAQLDASLQFLWSEAFGMPSVVNLSAVSNYKSGDFLVVSDPKVDAIVCSGCICTVDYPAVERVIGDSIVPSLLGVDHKGPFQQTTNILKGAFSQLGDYYVTTDASIGSERSKENV